MYYEKKKNEKGKGEGKKKGEGEGESACGPESAVKGLKYVIFI